MYRIQKISSFFVFLFRVLFILTPLWIVTQWLFIEAPLIVALRDAGIFAEAISTPEGNVFIEEVNWSFITLLLALFADVIYWLPFYASFWVFERLFLNYKRGVVFSVQNARSYKKLGFLLFFNALLANPIGNMLRVLAVTFDNLPGHRWITLSFGAVNLAELFLSAILMVVGWVMIEAACLAENEKLTV